MLWAPEWLAAALVYTRGDGGSCVRGLPDIKSFRSFTEKGVALKELILRLSADTPQHCTAPPMFAIKILLM